jgi:N-acetylglucosamine-6-phosphate deacetylase
MPVLVAHRVVAGDGGVSPAPAWVVVEGGRVLAVGTGAPPAGEQVAHDDCLLVPGFIDIQVNGVGALDFADASAADMIEVARTLAAEGCTTFVPTLVSAPLGRYESMLECMSEVVGRVDAVIGVHLEGPFLGGAPGAHPADLVRPKVDLDWLTGLCDRFPDLVRIVTLAPEADQDCAAIRALSARGIVVALGHSTATYAQAVAAADAGARLVTHLFNGMGPLHHREPGLPGAALDDHRLVPSIIADLVHVHPAALRIAFAARPDTALVTDRVGGDLLVRDGAARLGDDTLAGSVVTMLASVRNLVANGVPIALAVRSATANPARVLGLPDRGRIAAGQRADLVWLEPETLTVRACWPSADRPGS